MISLHASIWFIVYSQTAVKYYFAQADEILLKISAFKQYYVRKQELVIPAQYSCDV